MRPASRCNAHHAPAEVVEPTDSAIGLACRAIAYKVKDDSLIGIQHDFFEVGGHGVAIKVRRDFELGARTRRSFQIQRDHARTEVKRYKKAGLPVAGVAEDVARRVGPSLLTGLQSGVPSPHRNQPASKPERRGRIRRLRFDTQTLGGVRNRQPRAPSGESSTWSDF